MKTITTKITSILTLCLTLSVLGTNTVLSAITKDGRGTDKSSEKPTAPIIESGRLVGTLTNTAGTLVQDIQIPGFYEAVRNPDYTVEGKVNILFPIGPVLNNRLSQQYGPTPEVMILKVEDNLATVVPTGKGIPFLTPAVTIPYQYIRELKDLPHLTDSNTNWIDSEKILSSLQPVRDNFGKKWVSPINAPGEHKAFPRNYVNIPWGHTSVLNEYQALKVPITTQNAKGDNSTTVAVANALSYLYTKEATNPAQVSKAFLTWVHDAYPLNDNEVNSSWHPNDFINPKKFTEGESVISFDASYNGGHVFHPELLALAVASGNDHPIDLARLLKGVQRFGVALESEQPSSGAWTLPTSEVQSTAKSRITSKPITVRCFKGWEDVNYLYEYDDHSIDNYMYERDSYEAMAMAFITREVKKGHPVIISVLRENIPGSRVYTKKSFVITDTQSPTHHQSLQFLTPSGKFEDHNFLGANPPEFGEVLDPNLQQNRFGALKEMKLLSPLLKRSNKAIWPKVDYTDQQKKGLQPDGYTTPKFEVYSLGFE